MNDNPDALFSLKEASYESIIDSLKIFGSLQPQGTPENKVFRQKLGEINYELFKMHRDASGDIHICMNYLN